MRVYRNTYRDAGGKRREALKWYVEFRDHERRQRRLPAFTDKGASAELGRKLETLGAYRASGKDPAPLGTWIDSLPQAIATLLVKWGMLAADRAGGNKTLASHLKDYKADMQARRLDDVYIKCAMAQIQAILDGCGFVYWPEVSRTRSRCSSPGSPAGRRSCSRRGAATGM